MTDDELLALARRELRDTMATWLLEKINADEVLVTDAIVAAAGLTATMIALLKNPEHRAKIAGTINETLLDHANQLAGQLAEQVSPDQQVKR